MAKSPGSHRADPTNEQRAISRKIAADAEALDQQRASRQESMTLSEMSQYNTDHLEDQLGQGSELDDEAIRFQIAQRDRLKAERAKSDAEDDGVMDPWALASRIPRGIGFGSNGGTIPGL